jgi:hypothetical protein
MHWLNGSHWRFISKSPDTNLLENAIRPTALGKNYEQSGIRQSLLMQSISSRRA